MVNEYCPDSEALHRANLDSNAFNSCSNSEKAVCVAEGWQKITKLGGISFLFFRQMDRNRLLRRLRFTALPSLRRTTMVVPCFSRPWRTQRLAPLTQLIKQGYTARRLRPFLRRRFNIARPDAVLMRLRKPCLLRRFLLLG